MQKQFPCTTIGGTKRGKPCSFPFIFNGMEGIPKISLNCSLVDDVRPWCSTRTTWNNSYILEDWGYCSKDCHGALPMKSDSTFNLAHDEHSHLWEEDLYSLGEFDAGYCHTYHPEFPSLSGYKGQLFALLGQLNDTKEEHQLYGYDIFLHEKGQFWPGLEMERTGLSEIIVISNNMEQEGYFTFTETTSLDHTDAPCVSDPSYSYKECMFNYVAKTTGCFLDWFNPPKMNYNRCSSNEEILKYNEIMDWALTSTWKTLANTTSCHAKCTVRKYVYTKTKEENITWKHDFSSSFYLTAKRSLFKKEDEFWVFQLSDAINGIGGALGLCLGWSGAFVVKELIDVAKLSVTYLFRS